MSVVDMQLKRKANCNEENECDAGVYVQKESTSLGRSQMYSGGRILAILATGYSIQL